MDIKTLTTKVEQVSQIYAKRFGITRNKAWFVLKLQEEMGELMQSYLMMSGQARTKDKQSKELKADFENEVADILSHTLLLAKHFNIDVEKVIKKKWLKWIKQ